MLSKGDGVRRGGVEEAVQLEREVEAFTDVLFLARPADGEKYDDEAGVVVPEAERAEQDVKTDEGEIEV